MKTENSRINTTLHGLWWAWSLVGFLNHLLTLYLSFTVTKALFTTSLPYLLYIHLTFEGQITVIPSGPHCASIQSKERPSPCTASVQSKWEHPGLDPWGYVLQQVSTSLLLCTSSNYVAFTNAPHSAYMMETTLGATHLIPQTLISWHKLVRTE